MKITVWRWRVNGVATLLAGLLVVGIAGCTGSEDQSGGTSTGSTQVKLNTPAEIAQTSAANYDDNSNGLITGNTLERWIDNWTANRPAGITGKLVILQASNGEAGFEFIKPDNTDVFTYSVPSSEWIETRSNGVIETPSVVPSGRLVDTFLAKYDLNPVKDMIVCAQGTAGAGQAMRAGRCWYMLRYWGTNKTHLAVLNGGNAWNGSNTLLDASHFSTAGSPVTFAGSCSVTDLPENNFSLQATVEDMMSAVPAQDANLRSDGVFVWDARSTGEYSPMSAADFRNGGSTQGHPNGALLLPYSDLLDADAGYTFKSKAQLQAYINGDVDGNGAGFVDSTLQAVGYGSAYQSGDTVYTYCETTFRAMITGMASAIILGLPTRFYDGAMVEWHSLSNVVASDGEPILPSDSPWRTDVASFSMFMVAGDPSTVATRTITNAYAASANAVIDEDMAYKGIVMNGDMGTGSVTSDTGGSSTAGSGSSAGGGLPPNPCGG